MIIATMKMITKDTSFMMEGNKFKIKLSKIHLRWLIEIFSSILKYSFSHKIIISSKKACDFLFGLWDNVS